jgi:hypothetical protein
MVARTHRKKPAVFGKKKEEEKGKIAPTLFPLTYC